MNISSSTRVGALVCAALILGGCATSTQSAAIVGSHSVSVDDVKVVGDALCAERAAIPADQNPGELPLSQVHNQALQALVDAELTAQFTKDSAYSPALLNAQLKNVDPLIARLPADEQTQARDLISKIFVGQLRLAKVGADKVGLPATSMQPQQLLAAGLQERAAFDQATKVEVNPRYSVNIADTGSQSLSRPVSSIAKGGFSTSPDSAFIASLPADQKCGR